MNSFRSSLTQSPLVAPSSSLGIIADNARILEALEQPIPMRFVNATPLEDVLAHIKAESRRLNHAIPIYLDPIGLNETEKTQSLPVTIDLEGVPLKTSLRLLLKPLNLDYRVREGVLWIGIDYYDLEGFPKIYEDPFLIVGHCLMALLAVGMGGVAAPLIADPARRIPGQARRKPEPTPS